MKSIKVTKDVWRRVHLLKKEQDHKYINETIEWLLANRSTFIYKVEQNDGKNKILKNRQNRSTFKRKVEQNDENKKENNIWKI